MNEPSERIEALRQAVKAEAESWLQTPYHHMAHIKGVGADCVGILAGVAENTGLVDKVEMPAYSPQWHLHQRRSLLRENVAKYCRLVSDETPEVGDIMIFTYGQTYAHSAIVIGWPYAVHASLKSRCVELVDVERDEHLGKCERELWRPLALCIGGD